MKQSASSASERMQSHDTDPQYTVAKVAGTLWPRKEEAEKTRREGSRHFGWMVSVFNFDSIRVSFQVILTKLHFWMTTCLFNPLPTRRPSTLMPCYLCGHTILYLWRQHSDIMTRKETLWDTLWRRHDMMTCQDNPDSPSLRHTVHRPQGIWYILYTFLERFNRLSVFPCIQTTVWFVPYEK